MEGRNPVRNDLLECRLHYGDLRNDGRCGGDDGNEDKNDREGNC